MIVLCLKLTSKYYGYLAIVSDMHAVCDYDCFKSVDVRLVDGIGRCQGRVEH